MDLAAIRAGILRKSWQGRVSRVGELIRWDCHPTIRLCGVGVRVKLVPSLFSCLDYKPHQGIHDASREECSDPNPGLNSISCRSEHFQVTCQCFALLNSRRAIGICYAASLVESLDSPVCQASSAEMDHLAARLSPM
jgi:hypothetical protein